MSIIPDCPICGGTGKIRTDNVGYWPCRRCGGPPEYTHALTSEGHDASEDGTGQGTPLTANGSSVRRLTPRECERLQGFPDDWTLIDWQGKPAPDSRRYAACGDAVTVPVAEWIGRRLAAA